MYKPETVIDTNNVKIYWDRQVLTEYPIVHNRLGIILQEKRSKIIYILDVIITTV